MSPETAPLKYGLVAHYVTHAEIARQRRAQGRKTANDNKAQPDEEHNGTRTRHHG